MWVNAVARVCSLFCLVWLPALPVTAQSPDPATLVRERLEELQGDSGATILNASVASPPLLLEVYARRDFEPAWRDARSREELLAIIEASEEEGLDPEDYHAAPLRKWGAKATGAAAKTALDYDIPLTDALVRLGAHLRFGKVDPVDLDANWNVGRELKTDDAVGVFAAAIDAATLREFIDERIPRQDFYLRFKAALARYRAIRAAGAWPAIPDGAVLKPGQSDPSVPLLRTRLAAEGDLEAGANATSELYDSDVEQAVERFQLRHGLDADGVTGGQTIAAMNVTVDARIDQIKANLERSRWVFTDLTGDFIVVNIAGYRAYLVKEDALVWTTNVMVGTPYRKTPVFKDEMSYLVLNPTWTVPPGILRKDFLPRIKKDPDYLRSKGYLLLDRDGKEVDHNGVDWSALGPRNFPYIIRQPPGPDNAMGQVKFMFPNDHFVFLHDTNRRELFVRPARAFSSGCIRVENPLELAELLLNDPQRWNADGIKQALATQRTQTVRLTEPLPVLLLYWTAVAVPDGSVTFYKDVYGRDQKVIDGLAEPFKLAIPARSE